MSATRNTEGQESGAEFKANVPRDEPQTQKGHKPGVMASPYDRAPQNVPNTMPPGTIDHSNIPSEEVKRTGPEQNTLEQGVRVPGAEAARSELPGTTSQDVYTGIGKPAQGMTSAQKHHDAQAHREKQGTGLTKQGMADPQ